MLEALGFGFAEIGSVSARPSSGNPRPRLFRLPAEQAIVVNYGLPNEGAETVARRLARHRSRRPVGVNVVKTNDGPEVRPATEDEIIGDYLRSVTLLHPHAAYLMLNLSCPNATGGDTFARKGVIAALLRGIAAMDIDCPVFLKIPPLDAPCAHDHVLEECDPFPFVRGFCFNLPAGKPDALRRIGHLPGAVAGKPVEGLVNRCIAGMYARMDRRRHAIIGAGGVFTAEDAYRKIRLGASLIQIYTALIYQGPAVTARIVGGLAGLLRRDGFSGPHEAVGIDVGRPT